MRPPKFRVWCKNRNEWEHPSYLTEQGELLHTIPNGKNFIPYKLENHIVEFYTGLKDKNAKDVFEGDRLFLEHYDPWIVDWSDGGFVVYNESNPDFVEYPLTQSMAEIREVIGNIHEEDIK